MKWHEYTSSSGCHTEKSSGGKQSTETSRENCGWLSAVVNAGRGLIGCKLNMTVVWGKRELHMQLGSMVPKVSKPMLFTWRNFCATGRSTSKHKNQYWMSFCPHATYNIVVSTFESIFLNMLFFCCLQRTVSDFFEWQRQRNNRWQIFLDQNFMLNTMSETEFR